MKAPPHTHIGIARDEVGLFLGSRFLGDGQGTLLAQLLVYYPEAKSAIVLPLDMATRWELKEVTTTFTEWVEGDASEE